MHVDNCLAYFTMLMGLSIKNVFSSCEKLQNQQQFCISPVQSFSVNLKILWGFKHWGCVFLRKTEYSTKKTYLKVFMHAW